MAGKLKHDRGGAHANAATRIENPYGARFHALSG
jgi:hypothetical protein